MSFNFLLHLLEFLCSLLWYLHLDLFQFQIYFSKNSLIFWIESSQDLSCSKVKEKSHLPICPFSALSQKISPPLHKILNRNFFKNIFVFSVFNLVLKCCWNTWYLVVFLTKHTKTSLATFLVLTNLEFMYFIYFWLCVFLFPIQKILPRL